MCHQTWGEVQSKVVSHLGLNSLFTRVLVSRIASEIVIHHPASNALASALVIERQAADVSRGFLVSQGTERRCSRIFCHHGLRWTGHQTLQEAQDDCARGRRLSSTFDKELKLKTASKKIIHHSLLRCATSHQTSRPRSGRAVRICYGASVSAGGIGSVQQNLLSLVPAESAP
jgi:hypothetical protein